jgi:hypothetical protein
VPQQTKCEACQRVLRIPDDVTEPSLTCPRCLAKVPNPNVMVRSGPPPREGSPDVLAAQPAITTLPCPRCGKPVERAWRRCPYCEEPLRRSRAQTSLASVDAEVRRDTGAIGGGLILLAALGGLGIALFFFRASAAAARGGAQPLVIGLVVLLFLALLSTGIVLWRTRENPAKRGIGRVVFGTLALAGTLIAGTFLLGLAALVFLFIACASGARF